MLRRQSWIHPACGTAQPSAWVSVSDSRDYLDGLMKNVERQALRIANNAGAEVADSFVEFL